VKFIVACCHSAMFFAHAARAFRSQQLSRVCNTGQKPCSAKCVVGKASNNSFTFTQSFGKRSLPLIQTFDLPSVRNITTASSSLWMSSGPS